jgi:hypothetical protein
VCPLTIVFVFLVDTQEYYVMEHLVKELLIVVQMVYVSKQTIVHALMGGRIQIVAHFIVILLKIALFLKELVQVHLNAIVQINGLELTVILQFVSLSVRYHLWFVQEMEIAQLLTNANVKMVGLEIIVNLLFAITSMQQILLFVIQEVLV